MPELSKKHSKTDSISGAKGTPANPSTSPTAQPEPEVTSSTSMGPIVSSSFVLGINETEPDGSTSMYSTWLTNRQQSQNPFECFIAVAFSTLITVLLAWRILFTSDKEDEDHQVAVLNRNRKDQSHTSGHGRYEDTSLSTATQQPGHSQSAESSYHSRMIVDEQGDAFMEMDTLLHRDVDSRSGSDRPVLVPNPLASMIATASGATPTSHHPMDQGDRDRSLDELNGYESDLSSSEGPAFPPYLDTITEEDTDDLMSLSSSDSGRPVVPGSVPVEHDKRYPPPEERDSDRDYDSDTTPQHEPKVDHYFSDSHKTTSGRSSIRNRKSRSVEDTYYAEDDIAASSSPSTTFRQRPLAIGIAAVTHSSSLGNTHPNNMSVEDLGYDVESYESSSSDITITSSSITKRLENGVLESLIGPAIVRNGTSGSINGDGLPMDRDAIDQLKSVELVSTSFTSRHDVINAQFNAEDADNEASARRPLSGYYENVNENARDPVSELSDPNNNVSKASVIGNSNKSGRPASCSEDTISPKARRLMREFENYGIMHSSVADKVQEYDALNAPDIINQATAFEIGDDSVDGTASHKSPTHGKFLSKFSRSKTDDQLLSSKRRKRDSPSPPSDVDRPLSHPGYLSKQSSTSSTFPPLSNNFTTTVPFNKVPQVPPLIYDKDCDQMIPKIWDQLEPAYSNSDFKNHPSPQIRSLNLTTTKTSITSIDPITDVSISLPNVAQNHPTASLGPLHYSDPLASSRSDGAAGQQLTSPAVDRFLEAYRNYVHTSVTMSGDSNSSSRSSSQQSIPPGDPIYDAFNSEFPQLFAMDLNLEKSSEQIRKYARIYRDARRSGMEEFEPELKLQRAALDELDLATSKFVADKDVSMDISNISGSSDDLMTPRVDSNDPQGLINERMFSYLNNAALHDTNDRNSPDRNINFTGSINNSSHLAKSPIVDDRHNSFNNISQKQTNKLIHDKIISVPAQNSLSRASFGASPKSQTDSDDNFRTTTIGSPTSFDNKTIISSTPKSSMANGVTNPISDQSWPSPLKGTAPEQEKANLNSNNGKYEPRRLPGVSKDEHPEYTSDQTGSQTRQLANHKQVQPSSSSQLTPGLAANGVTPDKRSTTASNHGNRPGYMNQNRLLSSYDGNYKPESENRFSPTGHKQGEIADRTGSTIQPSQIVTNGQGNTKRELFHGPRQESDLPSAWVPAYSNHTPTDVDSNSGLSSDQVDGVGGSIKRTHNNCLTHPKHEPKQIQSGGSASNSCGSLDVGRVPRDGVTKSSSAGDNVDLRTGSYFSFEGNADNYNHSFSSVKNRGNSELAIQGTPPSVNSRSNLHIGFSPGALSSVSNEPSMTSFSDSDISVITIISAFHGHDDKPEPETVREDNEDYKVEQLHYYDPTMEYDQGSASINDHPKSKITTPAPTNQISNSISKSSPVYREFNIPIRLDPSSSKSDLTKENYDKFQKSGSIGSKIGGRPSYLSRSFTTDEAGRSSIMDDMDRVRSLGFRSGSDLSESNLTKYERTTTGERDAMKSNPDRDINWQDHQIRESFRRSHEPLHSGKVTGDLPETHPQTMTTPFSQKRGTENVSVSRLTERYERTETYESYSQSVFPRETTQPRIIDRITLNQVNLNDIKGRLNSPDRIVPSSPVSMISDSLVVKQIPMGTASIFTATTNLKDAAESGRQRKTQPKQLSPENPRSTIKVTSYNQPDLLPSPIHPPSELREYDLQRDFVAPQHWLSAERLQKMIEPLGKPPSAASVAPRPAKDYEEKNKSRETVFPADGEHVPETDDNEKGSALKQPVPLNEQNLQLWSKFPENKPSPQQNLMRWRNSVNLADELEGILAGSDSANKSEPPPPGLPRTDSPSSLKPISTSKLYSPTDEMIVSAPRMISGGLTSDDYSRQATGRPSRPSSGGYVDDSGISASDPSPPGEVGYSASSPPPPLPDVSPPRDNSLYTPSRTYDVDAVVTPFLRSLGSAKRLNDSDVRSPPATVTPTATSPTTTKSFVDEKFDAAIEKARNQRASNRYKAKIDRAKKEFIYNSKASASDLTKTAQEFEEKFKISMENVTRKPRPPRGPLLEMFHSPEFRSQVDIRYREVRPDLRAPEPLWDDEYKKIVANAEQMWAAYREKINPPRDFINYKNPRAFSMGYLEQEQQDQSGWIPTSRPAPEGSRLNQSGVEVGGPTLDEYIDQEARESRSRTKSSTDINDAEFRNQHSRAKSMDYIMDRRGREEVEPPENQLKKILGDSFGDPNRPPSEHELRFQKSTEKLHVPDWYLNSDYIGGKYEHNRSADNGGIRSQASTPATPAGYGDQDKPPTEPPPPVPTAGGTRPYAVVRHDARQQVATSPVKALSTSPAPTSSLGQKQNEYAKDFGRTTGSTKYVTKLTPGDQPATAPRSQSPAAFQPKPISQSTKPAPASAPAHSAYQDITSRLRQTELSLLTKYATGVPQPYRRTEPIKDYSDVSLPDITPRPAAINEPATVKSPPVVAKDDDRKPTPVQSPEPAHYYRKPAGPPPSPPRTPKTIVDGSNFSHDSPNQIEGEEEEEPSPPGPTGTEHSMTDSGSFSMASFDLPKNFFDKYKDEIEEMRKSRRNLDAPADSAARSRDHGYAGSSEQDFQLNNNQPRSDINTLTYTPQSSTNYQHNNIGISNNMNNRNPDNNLRFTSSGVSVPVAAVKPFEDDPSHHNRQTSGGSASTLDRISQHGGGSASSSMGIGSGGDILSYYDPEERIQRSQEIQRSIVNPRMPQYERQSDPTMQQQLRSNDSSPEWGAGALQTSTPHDSGQMPRREFNLNQPRRDAAPPSPGSTSSSVATSGDPFRRQTTDTDARQHHQPSPQSAPYQPFGRELNAKYSRGKDGSPHTTSGAGPIPAPRASIERDQRPILIDQSPGLPQQEPPPLQYTGYTVVEPPNDWNLPRDRNSKVIEVADLVSEINGIDDNGKPRPLAKHVTLEEVLDSLLSLPTRSRAHGSQDMLDQTDDLTRLPDAARVRAAQEGGQAVFAHNPEVMLRAAKNPHLAENILKKEPLYVRCARCGSVGHLEVARAHYVSCRMCYVYYCSRNCRVADWGRHKERCTFARINTLCKKVIIKVRLDPEVQYQMSRVARQNYSERGRGSVNFRFHNPNLADVYVRGGYSALLRHPGNYLYYLTVPDLAEQRKNPDFISLCRRYKPDMKFVLSVSIIADMDVCPETPPPSPATERRLLEQSTGPRGTDDSAEGRQQSHRPSAAAYRPGLAPIYGSTYTIDSQSTTNQPWSDHDLLQSQASLASTAATTSQDRFKQRATSLPPSSVHRNRAKKQENGIIPHPEDIDAQTLLRSVLKSMENIAPGPPAALSMVSSDLAQQNWSMGDNNNVDRQEAYGDSRSGRGFDRSTPGRHTISGYRGRGSAKEEGPVFYDGPSYFNRVQQPATIGESEV